MEPASFEAGSVDLRASHKRHSKRKHEKSRGHMQREDVVDVKVEDSSKIGSRESVHVEKPQDEGQSTKSQGITWDISSDSKEEPVSNEEKHDCRTRESITGESNDSLSDSGSEADIVIIDERSGGSDTSYSSTASSEDYSTSEEDYSTSEEDYSSTEEDYSSSEEDLSSEYSSGSEYSSDKESDNSKAGTENEDVVVTAGARILNLEPLKVRTRPSTAGSSPVGPVSDSGVRIGRRVEFGLLSPSVRLPKNRRITIDRGELTKLNTFVSSIRLVRDYSSRDVGDILTEANREKDRMKRIETLTRRRNSHASHPFLNLQFHHEIEKEWNSVINARRMPNVSLFRHPGMKLFNVVCLEVIDFVVGKEESDPFFNRPADRDNYWTKSGFRNYTRKVMEEEKGWYNSFSRCIEDEIGVEYFHNFMRTEFSAENILFYKAVKLFKAELLYARDGGEKVVNLMFDVFVKDGSVFEINISCMQKEDIFGEISCPRSNIFDSALNSLLDITQKGTWERFKQSKFFEDMIHAYLRSLEDKVPFEKPKPLEDDDIPLNRPLVESLEYLAAPQDEMMNMW